MDIKRVRIKTWEQLESCCSLINEWGYGELEFKNDTGSILFLNEMRKFCGEEFIVEVDKHGKFKYAGYTFVPDMYEVIEDNLAFNASSLPDISFKIRHYDRDKEFSIEYGMTMKLEDVLDVISKGGRFHQTMEVFGIPTDIFIE